jgi:hypothetical protein
MGHVHSGRPFRRSGVDHLEYGLQVPVEIHDGADEPKKFKWLVALVPPSVGRTQGKFSRFARPSLDALPPHRGSQASSDHRTLFTLPQVHMKRRALTSWRE